MRRLFLALIPTLVGATLVVAHDMFLKPSQFFVAENDTLPAVVLNGTFVESANSIERARIAELVVLSPSGRHRLDTTDWKAAGDTSRITFKTGSAGTYVYGVSTRSSEIELDAKDFNQYLRDDGLPDELARRRATGEIALDAKERYAKHVKAIVQVGDARSEHYGKLLGFPAEIVPLVNPYGRSGNRRIGFKVLFKGRPVPNAFVLYGGTGDRGSRIAERSLRTGPDGTVEIGAAQRGVWYLKYIHMARLAGNPNGVTHESHWTTVTFGVR
jgi:uncharacterized GH25 family protein